MTNQQHPITPPTELVAQWSNSMTDHFVEVPKKVLSPAAQAVLDAVFDHWPGGYNHPGKPLCIAAALRALADQVVPHPGRYPMNSYMDGIRDAKQDVRAEILTIATELEGQ